MIEDPADRGLIFLSTAPARRRDQRAGVAFVVISLGVCLAAIPYVALPWPQIPAFIPAYEAALIINDFITAVLLLGQFQEVRTRSLLILGGGYLFDALIVLVHALSFPGLFAEHGLIGGAQSTAWIYVFWHGLFPIFVIAYALAARPDEPPLPAEQIPGALLRGVAWPVILAVLAMLVATAGHDALPALLDGNQYREGVTRPVMAATWVVSLIALVILVAWTRLRRILDLWLAAVMGAWLIDILLSAILNSARYQVGFYVGRIYGLLAASFVLVALLQEMIGLYGRLARSLAEARRSAADLARSEAALRQVQKMEAIGKLTGGVAHEFNNLLTVVVGNLDFIIKESVAEPVQRMASAALRAALRGARLTSQLLVFARKKAMQPETVNLNRLLLDFENLARRAVDESIALEMRLDPGLDPAHIDVAQFEAAVLNLVMNARDAVAAAHGRGMIIMETRNAHLGVEATLQHAEARPGDYVVIGLRDNGEGIAPDILPRVFEPFFTTREIGKGTGLGLSQVYGFAKESGGFVEIMSTRGTGTSVELWLPRAAAIPSLEPLARAEGPAAALRPAGAGEVVLVVEDNLDVLATVVASLNDLGYRTLMAEDARAALAVLETVERIDILFSDVVMPGGMNGAQLAVAARERRPGLKVLLTSGYTAETVVGMARVDRLPAGVPLLHKPYRREELATTLEKIRRNGA